MLRFFKRRKDNKIISEEMQPQTDKISFDFWFNKEMLNFKLVTEEQNKILYLYEWLKNDGDWVDEGKPIFRIRVGDYISTGTSYVSEPFISEKCGILEQHKLINAMITNGDKIYTIHPKGYYKKENIPSNESFFHFFDKNNYEIPENCLHHNLEIDKWHKQDGEYVKINDLLFSLGFVTSYYNKKEPINHFAEKEGYLDIEIVSDILNELKQNELVYAIHTYDEERIKRKFINIPEIKIDEFTSKKTISWKSIGGHRSHKNGIASYSLDGKITLSFSFNNIDNKDYIVFNFYSNEIMLSKDDSILFLFDNKNIIDFTLSSNSYKLSDKVFENRLLISDEELSCFEKNNFLKWKVIQKKSNVEIIGGEEGFWHYKPHHNLVTVIKKFTGEYRELVRNEIPNYKPFSSEEILKIKSDYLADEECFVYFMIDTSNGFQKIGISNKPYWREKTLQSEKPTIELIACKKFISRKIASSIEKALHETYSEKRIRGEWFKLEDKDIAEIKATLNS